MLMKDPKRRITASDALSKYTVICQKFSRITFSDQCLFHGYLLDMTYFSLVSTGGNFSGNIWLVWLVPVDYPRRV